MRNAHSIGGGPARAVLHKNHPRLAVPLGPGGHLMVDGTGAYPTSNHGGAGSWYVCERPPTAHLCAEMMPLKRPVG
eukprot:scaffold40180_cov32-Tisochrysis_lutea.AAC.2